MRLNSMTTDHSRKLRSTTATNWNKVAREQGRIAQITMSGDAALINSIRMELEALNAPGATTTAQKVNWLIQRYLLNEQNPTTP